jgi:hypothetical protein
MGVVMPRTPFDQISAKAPEWFCSARETRPDQRKGAEQV